MLVLSRKRDSSIHIGADIRVTILGIRGNQVKVGVEARRPYLYGAMRCFPKAG